MTSFNSAYNVNLRPRYFPIETTPRISFDLYDPREQSIDYSSPTSSVIIHHHHPVYSPSPRPLQSQAVSKLRQINNELCHTLAQCDLNTDSYPSPSPHYHVHHYPISRSPSSSSSSSSSDFEPISPKKPKARVTYKARVPRPRSELENLLISTSDAYTQQEPTTVDIYPSREHGFVKHIRNRPDNQSPWLPERRFSFSETPRAPNYENQLLQPNNRLLKANKKPERRRRSFSASAPVWRPNGSIKPPKFIGSNGPLSKPKPARREPVWNPTGSIPKAKPFHSFEPTSTVSQSKAHEPVWHPPSANPTRKPTKYFEPTSKIEAEKPIKKEFSTKIKTKTRVQSANPQLKARVASATSKIDSAWKEPPSKKTRKPPIAPPPPVPKQKPKPKPKPPANRKVIDTGRNSMNYGPGQSTPKPKSFQDSDEEVSALFGRESPIPKPAVNKEKTPPKSSTPIQPAVKKEKTPPKSPEPEVTENSMDKSEIASVIENPPDEESAFRPIAKPDTHRSNYSLDLTKMIFVIF